MELKLDNQIKKLLTTYDVPEKVINLIENHYSGLLTDIKAELKESGAEQVTANQKDGKPISIMDMARENRIIK